MHNKIFIVRNMCQDCIKTIVAISKFCNILRKIMIQEFKILFNKCYLKISAVYIYFLRKLFTFITLFYIMHYI